MRKYTMYRPVTADVPSSVDRIATFRTEGGSGIAEHDISLHVPRIQKKNPYSTYIVSPIN